MNIHDLCTNLSLALCLSVSFSLSPSRSLARSPSFTCTQYISLYRSGVNTIFSIRTTSAMYSQTITKCKTIPNAYIFVRHHQHQQQQQQTATSITRTQIHVHIYAYVWHTQTHNIIFTLLASHERTVQLRWWQCEYRYTYTCMCVCLWMCKCVCECTPMEKCMRSIHSLSVILSWNPFLPSLFVGILHCMDGSKWSKGDFPICFLFSKWIWHCIYFSCRWIYLLYQ